jgi:hypothetical protein
MSRWHDLELPEKRQPGKPKTAGNNERDENGEKWKDFGSAAKWHSEPPIDRGFPHFIFARFVSFVVHPFLMGKAVDSINDLRAREFGGVIHLPSSSK